MSCLDFKISENKAIEIELSLFKEWWNYFDFYVKLTRKQDHAGFRFGIEIMRFYFCFQIYDIRHWDIDNDKWVVY